MAGGFDLGKLKKIITCKLCNQMCNTTDRQAKSMPCTHYLCVFCMKDYIDRNKRQVSEQASADNGDPGQKKFELVCPHEECGTTFIVSDRGVDDLPTHLYLQTLLERFPPGAFDHLPTGDNSDSDSPEVGSDTLDKSVRPKTRPPQQSVVASRCEDEEDAATSKGTSGKKVDNECEMHPGQECLLVCKDCKLALCSTCMVDPQGDHMKHQLDEIEVAIQQVMKDVETELAKLKVSTEKLNVCHQLNFKLAEKKFVLYTFPTIMDL